MTLKTGIIAAENSSINDIAGLSLVSTWMGDHPGKTRLLLVEVLVRPAGGAH